MSNKIQVYIGRKISSRLKYALDLVLVNILGLDYILSEEPDRTKALINYSNDRSIGGIFIQPEALLFENGIRKQDIWVAHMDGLPLFFQQPPEAGFLIDIFAFSFYLASRYEEYLPFTRDEHGRFAAEYSMAYKHNFLKRPVVDLWAIRLADTLKMLYPDLRLEERKYDALLTIDLDQPYAYRGKGMIRNMGGLVLDLFRGRDAARRLRCMAGRRKDPYDTYTYINTEADKNECPIIYFFTTGKRSRFDLNPSPYRRCYKRLIKSLTIRYGMGLHPSYKSYREPALIQKEIDRLETVSGKKVDSVRKHFLLLSFPDTYQLLMKFGIKKDYTLGYVREPGFRAGIARPFKFYDLSREEITDLSLVPFQYMEGTLQQYKRYTPKESREIILSLINETRSVGGKFVSVWHNTSLTDKDEWKGWREVFEYTLKKQKP